MRRVARLVTIFLLLLAVPVKGALAVSMVMCGPEHGRAVGSQLVDAGSLQKTRAHNPQHEHGSEAHMYDGDARDGDSSNTLDHEFNGKHGAMKCTICAACCVGGAAMASTNVSVPASVGTELPFPALDVQFPWTIIAGLERPPRTLLV